MSARAFASVTGVAVMLAGLILLLMPVTVTTYGETATCNASAAFDGVPNDLLLNNDAYEDFHTQCADSRSSRQAWGFGLIGLGGLGVAGSLAIRRQPVAA